MLLWAYPIAAGLFVARNIAWLGNQLDSTLPLPWCYLPTLWRPAGVLSNMIEGKQVHCLQVGEGTPCDGRSKPTSRDRIVAQCFLDTLDVAEEMAKSGTASDWPKFSGGHYKVSDNTCVRK